MSETTVKKENIEQTEIVADSSVVKEVADQNKESDNSSFKRSRGDFKKNKKFPKRKQKIRSEFDQKILEIRRVTRVSSGGRRFTFSVAVVIGNKRGKVGVGIGKAGDTTLAIEKAVKDAQKSAINIMLTKSSSIPHQTQAKFNSAVVMLMPARGRGIIAGSALRDVIELGGLKDINAKVFSGSKNKLNIARATVKALSALTKTISKDDKNLKPKEEFVPKKNFERSEKRFLRSPRKFTKTESNK